jgi:hypothetical protein
VESIPQACRQLLAKSILISQNWQKRKICWKNNFFFASLRLNNLSVIRFEQKILNAVLAWQIQHFFG